MYRDLEILVRDLMTRIIKHEVINTTGKSTVNLTKFDVRNTDNYVHAKRIDVGFEIVRGVHKFPCSLFCFVCLCLYFLILVSLYK